MKTIKNELTFMEGADIGLRDCDSSDPENPEMLIRLPLNLEQGKPTYQYEFLQTLSSDIHFEDQEGNKTGDENEMHFGIYRVRLQRGLVRFQTIREFDGKGE